MEAHRRPQQQQRLRLRLRRLPLELQERILSAIIILDRFESYDTIDFKKTLLEEQKKGEERIQELNNSIESAKKQIDDERVQLEEFRVKLKQTNEQKDTELTRYTEMKTTLIEPEIE